MTLISFKTRPSTSALFAALLATTAVTVASPATAASVVLNTDFSASTPSGNTYSYSSPFYPFKALGVNATVGYEAIQASASFSGSTTFDFPTFATGQLLMAGGLGSITHTSSFSSTNISGGVNFSGSLGYHIGVGPFSLDGTLGTLNLTPTISSIMTGNAPFGSSSASQGLGGPLGTFPIGAAAYTGVDPFRIKVGEVGINVTPGISATESIDWNAAFEFGHYSWTNSAGGLNAGDTPVWTASGYGNENFLSFTNPNTAADGSFFYNAVPGVRMNATFLQSQHIDFTLAGNFFASLFGKTLADYNLGTTNFSLFKEGQGFTSNNNEWYTNRVWSLPLMLLAGTTSYATVTGDGFFQDQNTIRNRIGNFNLLPDRPGGFLPAPGFTDVPNLEPVCVSNICYEMDDPNLPVTALISNVADVPEPQSWVLMILGFGLLGAALRRKRLALGAAEVVMT